MDVLLHAVVELDLFESAQKFVGYSLLYILKHLKK